MKTLDIPFEHFPFVVYNASKNDLEKYHSLINKTLDNLVVKKPKNTKTRFPRVFKLKRKYSFLHSILIEIVTHTILIIIVHIHIYILLIK